MKTSSKRKLWLSTVVLALSLSAVFTRAVSAADKFVTIISARVLAQAMPWIAQAAGLFQKYNLDHQLVYIPSSAIVTAAMLGGDADISLTGGVGNVRAYLQGATDLVFAGGVKNIMTQSIVAGGAIRKPEDLKKKRIGISRIGSNTEYFTIQALRRFGLEPIRDYSFIQTGGDPESLAALLSHGIEVATMAVPTNAMAVAQGYRYVVYGPDLRIPYAATSFVTLRSIIAKRPHVVGAFFRVMAEAAKILHTDKEFTYKVLAKELRVNDRKVLDASYNTEIKVLQPRLVLQPEALQAILDEVAQIDPRAKKVKPQDLMDLRYIDEMEKSGFFDKLYRGKDS